MREDIESARIPLHEDERGVALPLALIGLVAVTILVTTALVTSTTELAISNAHQDATASFYSVEGAMEEYVARMAEAAAAGSGELRTVEDDSLIPGFLISAVQLYDVSDTLPGGTLRRREIFSIQAEPASGRGRRIAAMIATAREAQRFRVNVNAGLTVGGNIEVTGSSTISDGRSADCDSTAAPAALQVSSGSTILRSGSAVIEGKADTASFHKEHMVDVLLGGMTLNEAARLATIKFAAGEFSGRAISHDSGTPRPQTHKYNWGCPSTDACATITGNEANVSYFPTVAIDAGGGKGVIDGTHGQGLLIIYNGSVEIKGKFVYKGIVLVERDLVVQGTGGGGVKLEGAVVALGENSAVEDNTSGNATITYNKCVITQAEEGANADRVARAGQLFKERTFGWQEIVR